MSTPDKKIVQAPRRTAVLYAVIGVVGVAGSIGMFAEGSVWIAICAAVVTLFWLTVAVRAWGNGVYTDGYQLINRNDLGRRRIAWVHVDRFEYRGIKGLGLWTKENEWVLLQYLPPRDDVVPPALAALNAELERVTV
ncbi:hypothetical protein KIH74_04525 [Kineosporia sp. J2-2]|uniref:PH domain-containing protein n=1 Tax=Kineosporia corallincola TaxID=2835133 RepID=A0ABS5TEZ3_9ACTN|nr:hypothetical protein [Kineosporia corallincola]MBT0768174.1 hypothetical protein [Kineosporia corallincola]